MPTASSPSRITVTYEVDLDDMRLRGRIGSAVQKSRHNTRDLTAAGRAAFLSKFEREVDPDGTLPPEERQRRAEYARKAHFARLARLSANARRTRRDAKAAPTAAAR